MGDALPPIDLGTEATPTSLISNNDGWFVCARFDNGGVKCWGRNTSSELGAEDKNNRGDEPDEMGDALPWLNLGTE